MRLHLEEEARAEFLESVQYYAEESARVASGFIDEIENALNEISLFPFRFPVYRRQYRVRHLKRYRHSLIYSVEGDEVTIVAIMHQKRKPGYWRKRK